MPARKTAVRKPADKPVSSIRRAPVQQRGRERIELLLGVAEKLIGERGSDALRMSEVAELAGVSIGSLYQYFPDKAAIIHTLAERYNAQGAACVRREIETVRDAKGLREALARSVDGYYQMMLAEPVMRDIWIGTQADKALRDIDLADMRTHAAMLRDAMHRVWPKVDKREIETTALLITQLTTSAIRLAVTLERDEGCRVVEAFKEMALREVGRTADRIKARR